jgi:hypothetical protein
MKSCSKFAGRWEGFGCALVSAQKTDVSLCDLPADKPPPIINELQQMRYPDKPIVAYKSGRGGAAPGILSGAINESGRTGFISMYLTAAKKYLSSIV